MIRFLKSFLSLFAALTKANKKKNLEVSLAPVDTAQEILSRYVLSSSQYRKTDVYVKASAFLPAPHPDTGFETSVFRTNTLSEHQIWQLGAEQLPDRTIYCRADLDQNAVMDIQPLRVAAETSTHPLHSIIVGWPQEKHAQKLLALQLEQIARSYAGPGHS
jgi:hypothetical protein